MKVDIPECCQDCRNLDSGYSDYSEETFYFCNKNLYWPMKTDVCKKQKKREEK